MNFLGRRPKPRPNLQRMPLDTLTPLLKTLALVSAASLILYLLLFPNPFVSPTATAAASVGGVDGGATELRHVVFGIASSSLSFDRRKEYIRLWWRPGIARGFVFLEKSLNSSGGDENLPTVVVSDASSRFPFTFKYGLRSAVRVARIVKEVIETLDRGQGLRHGDVKWIVLCDDDTLFFTENLIKTLAKYDWEQWYYIGGLSESVEQNSKNSFGMAFGGAGFAISYPLARVLSKVLDSCLMRYGHLYGSDARVFACLAELGVGLTHEPGFHQVDLRGDLFGMLNAHPLAPPVSLHHLDTVDPLYPGKNRLEGLKHLFEAIYADPGRVFQQIICYDNSNLLTVSVSWGYAVQVYEGNLLLPDLLSLQRTFTPWRRRHYSTSDILYMFNTREYPRDPCKRPAVFFLDKVLCSNDRVESSYKRNISGNCQQTGGPSKYLQKISVSSEKLDVQIRQVLAPRRHCCDVLASSEKMMEINIRQCKDDELIAMKP